ncbi:MAG: hypothetical protein H7Y12_11040 [Sphingobacteriaceae bacterium]|nr:hypothetical protein [Cytophagaceae bacterium]
MTTEEFLSKYEQLDEAGKTQIEAELNRLLERKPFDYEEYRQGLLQGSVWSEEDIKPILEAREQLANRRVQEW